MRRALALAGVFAALATMPATATPLSGPPEVDPHALPAGYSSGPSLGMEQRRGCIFAGGVPDQALTGLPPNLAALDLASAQQLSRGAGQTVAVLGTGSSRNPRLPQLVGGGDYVGSSDGTEDCDGVGTLVAGIIAAQPSATDGFTGVAPAAKIQAMRVSSGMFSVRSPGEDPALAEARVKIEVLAQAIKHAADLGATVIVVSSVVCVPVDLTVNYESLGAAVRYAAVDKDAVIVAAAGDGNQGGCAQNPLHSAGQLSDPRGWANAVSLSLPSIFQPYVVSVASLTPQGQPSQGAIAGPWVSVAAPGESVVSLSNAPDVVLANALLDEKGKPVSIQGSAYAAAYVGGTAALIRSRFPLLHASETRERIIRSAHNAARDPSNLVGYGTVDPLASLTWDIPLEEQGAPITAVRAVLPPAPAPRDAQGPKGVALVGVGLLVALVAALSAVFAWRKKGAVR